MRKIKRIVGFFIVAIVCINLMWISPTVKGMTDMSNSVASNIARSNVTYTRMLKLTTPMMQGEDVKALQERLKGLGYFSSDVDGIFGPLCDTAVKNYQKNNGLDVDGIVGPATWEKVFKNSSNPSGYTRLLYNTKPAIVGDDVKSLQTRLKELNYYTGEIDGEFGNLSENAVRLFQEKNSLDVDGICGANTWSKVFSTDAIKNSNISNNELAIINAGINIRYLRDLCVTNPNMSGDDVINLQVKLKGMSMYTGEIDGFFGQASSEAVKKLQSSYGLQATGICDAQTWMKLFGKLTNTAVKKIFIDAGHGGTEPGASQNEYIEKNYNLAISLEQQKLFENLGYEVKMTRVDDKTVSLKERTDMANEWGADIFISNHINAGGGDGVEAWVGINNQVSQKYGEKIVDKICKDVGFKSRGVKTKIGDSGKDYFAVIREAKMPSLIIEHGFIDNKENLNMLNSTEVIKNIAKATVSAINGEEYYDIADVNRDGQVTDGDVKAVTDNYNSLIGTSKYKAIYDVNQDGIIDLYDLVKISSKL